MKANVVLIRGHLLNCHMIACMSINSVEHTEFVRYTVSLALPVFCYFVV